MYKYRRSGGGRGSRPVGFIAGILLMAAAAGISGCAKKTVTQDGVETVEKEYTTGQIMVITATERNRYQNIYTDRLWQTPAEPGGITFEEKLKGQIEQFLIELAAINLMADEQKVDLTGQEKDSLKSLSQEYYRSLTQPDKEYIDISEDEVYQLYCEYYRADKLVSELTRDENLEVSDAEAKVIEVQQIVLESDGEARALLEQVHGEKADFASIASRNSKDGQINYRLEWQEDMNALEQAAFGLEQDEISGIVELDGRYYILKCTNAYDAKATLERKIRLSREKRTKAFLSFYEPFVREHQVRLKGDIWEKVDFSQGKDCKTDNFFQLYQSYFN